MSEQAVRRATLPEDDIENCASSPVRGNTTALVAVRPSLRPHVKRGIDVAGACLLLVLTLPVFVLAALLVKLDGGTVFFRHPRIGRGGRHFLCLKFRTMVPESEHRLAAMLENDPAAREEWERTRKLRQDPRVTRIGRFLRATSLDELPQLINVLRGEMSLVGPRPVPEEELRTCYGDAAVHYLSVQPGITGPWQVSGRNDTTYEQRVALDVHYAQNPSIRTDLLILLRTCQAVLLRRGAC